MTNILNTKILLSGATIVAAAALIVGATYAFFSDTETSEDNTFVAGSIDLLVNNTSFAFDHNIPNYPDPIEGLLVPSENTSWTTGSLEGEKFFDFIDLKPGDYGKDVISLQVDNNDAWICAATQVDAGDNAGLAENLNFAFWNDIDEDNIFDPGDGEAIFLQGPASGLNGAGQIALADSTRNIWTNPTTPGTPVAGLAENFVGKVWCYGELDVNPAGNTGTGFSCDGTDVTAGQGETLVGDIEFYAVQSRNNADFTCEDGYTPSWEQV